ncbi:MAG: AI-2E family transporter [Anaerohalosphaera sp.]|nr:AI-2E family transporter [Anaerohalosphaera sp.]
MTDKIIVADKAARESTRMITISLVIIAFVAVAVALKYTQPVMVPFMLAMFIVSMISPLLDRLVIKHKCPRPIAVLISVLVILTVIMIISLILISAAGAVINSVSSDDSSSVVAEESNSATVAVIKSADDEGNSIAGVAGDESDSAAVEESKKATSYVDTLQAFSSDTLSKFKVFCKEELNFEFNLDPNEVANQIGSMIPTLVTSTFGTAIGIITTIFFVVIFVIFMIAGRNPYVVHQGVFEEIDKNVRRYISTKLIVSFITGVLVWLILKIIGLELAGVFGVLAFLLNFIPSIGSMISTLLPIPIAFAQFESGWMIAAAIAGPGVVQITMGNIIEPKIMGQGLNLHPVTILLALSFWGLLWGVVGMFLAAPITAVIRIIFMQFDTLRPIGNLMAGQLPQGKKPGLT